MQCFLEGRMHRVIFSLFVFFISTFCSLAHAQSAGTTTEEIDRRIAQFNEEIQRLENERVRLNKIYDEATLDYEARLTPRGIGHGAQESDAIAQYYNEEINPAGAARRQAGEALVEAQRQLNDRKGERRQFILSIPEQNARKAPLMQRERLRTDLQRLEESYTSLEAQYAGARGRAYHAGSRGEEQENANELYRRKETIKAEIEGKKRELSTLGELPTSPDVLTADEVDIRMARHFRKLEGLYQSEIEIIRSEKGKPWSTKRYLAYWRQWAQFFFISRFIDSIPSREQRERYKKNLERRLKQRLGQEIAMEDEAEQAAPSAGAEPEEELSASTSEEQHPEEQTVRDPEELTVQELEQLLIQVERELKQFEKSPEKTIAKIVRIGGKLDMVRNEVHRRAADRYLRRMSRDVDSKPSAEEQRFEALRIRANELERRAWAEHQHLREAHKTDSQKSEAQKADDIKRDLKKHGKGSRGVREEFNQFR